MVQTANATCLPSGTDAARRWQASLRFRLYSWRAPSVGFVHAANAVDNRAVHRLALADIALHVVVIADKRVIDRIKPAQIAHFRVVSSRQNFDCVISFHGLSSHQLNDIYFHGDQLAMLDFVRKANLKSPKPKAN